MDELKAYLASLATESEREAFAVRCGTTIKHLRNVMYGLRTCSESLAAAMERESGGKLLCEQLAPHLSWRRVPDEHWPSAFGKPLVDPAPDIDKPLTKLAEQGA